MDTQLYFQSIGEGGLRQGISENQALRHATIFRFFDLTLKDSFRETRIGGGGGGAVGGTAVNAKRQERKPGAC